MPSKLLGCLRWLPYLTFTGSHEGFLFLQEMRVELSLECNWWPRGICFLTVYSPFLTPSMFPSKLNNNGAKW